MYRKAIFPALVSVAAVLYWTEVFTPGKKAIDANTVSLSRFSWKDKDGKDVLFSTFQDGKAVLIVNVATEVR